MHNSKISYGFRQGHKSVHSNQPSEDLELKMLSK